MKSNTYHPPPVPVLPESRDLLVLHFLFLLKTERSLITASHTNAPFRLANTIIRDLSHMSAVILLPFFLIFSQFVPNPFLLAFPLSPCSYLSFMTPPVLRSAIPRCLSSAVINMLQRIPPAQTH